MSSEFQDRHATLEHQKTNILLELFTLLIALKKSKVSILEQDSSNIPITRTWSEKACPLNDGHKLPNLWINPVDPARLSKGLDKKTNLKEEKNDPIERQVLLHLPKAPFLSNV